ncbi:MAG: dihydrofolate reductase [Rhodoferax sp.]|nr:dihydrofolate reductase [Rhodoferax sp.]
MQLKLIFARARNGVIGADNALPWHLPEDMLHFKRTTLGCPVIMGRKTWDSLPAKFRPLPGRPNIVVTRQTDWPANGAQVAHSIKQACALCPADATAWVIGGAELYAQAMAHATEAVVTEIDADFAGDTLAPFFGPDWREIGREAHTSSTGLPFSFVTYRHTIEPVNSQF